MSVQISRILHAGYVFSSDEFQIAFDPIFENPFSINCHAFPHVEFDHGQIRNLKLSAVFISHFHDDHCSLESLDLLNRDTPLYVYCVYPELISIIESLGFKKVEVLTLSRPIEIGPFSITAKKALDPEVDSIFHVSAKGLNILNVVDSWIDPETIDDLKAFAPWDLVLWPFQTMREIEVLAPTRSKKESLGIPFEWMEQLQSLKPRFIVPSSCQFIFEQWSWLNHTYFPISYQQFKTETESSLLSSKVLRLDPSVSVILRKTSLTPAPPLPWVSCHEPDVVDYEFKEDLIPTKTKDIAQKFQPLNSEQTAIVIDFCLNKITAIYNSLDDPNEDYFKKPRYWQLSLYNHLGVATEFKYWIHNNQMRLVTNETSTMNEPLSWSTELPTVKLFAALERGESLTSMYVRINEMVFLPEIEDEIGTADIIEDPLIRCLFNGRFAAYQLAQLAKIRSRELVLK